MDKLYNNCTFVPSHVQTAIVTGTLISLSAVSLEAYSKYIRIIRIQYVHERTLFCYTVKIADLYMHREILIGSDLY